MDRQTMDLRTIAPELERDERLDALVGPMREAVAALPSEALRALRGDGWLGHPVHPALTDLPIGFWTSAFVLDLVPSRRTRRLATTMVGLGLVTAAPTALAGLADWSTLSRGKQRVGAAHALANATGTALYALSFLSRLRGRHRKGAVLGMVAAASMTVGGFLGGHLAYGTSAPDEPARDDEPVSGDGAEPAPTPLAAQDAP